MKTFKFQDDNKIIQHDENNYQFKDSYTIKIHDCKASDYDKSTLDVALPKRDFELETFFSMIFDSVGLENGNYKKNFLKNNVIKTHFDDSLVIESKSKNIKNRVTKFNPFEDEKSFKRLKNYKLTIVINLSKLTINNDKDLIVHLSLKKLIIHVENRTEVVRGPNIEELIKKNYVPPIVNSESKLNKVYNVSNKYITNFC